MSLHKTICFDWLLHMSKAWWNVEKLLKCRHILLILHYQIIQYWIFYFVYLHLLRYTHQQRHLISSNSLTTTVVRLPEQQIVSTRNLIFIWKRAFGEIIYIFFSRIASIYFQIDLLVYVLKYVYSIYCFALELKRYTWLISIVTFYKTVFNKLTIFDISRVK